jgi:hypothetical protein
MLGCGKAMETLSGSAVNFSAQKGSWLKGETALEIGRLKDAIFSAMSEANMAWAKPCA